MILFSDMSLTDLFMQIIPKCSEHNITFEQRSFSITTSDGNSFGDLAYYCPKCDAYLGKKGLEKDLKKVALDSLQRLWNSSYELSDIVNIKVLKV